MKKFNFITGILVFLSLPQAVALTPFLSSVPVAGCLSQHIEDSLNLNIERATKYSIQTQGRSEAVSDLLIEVESESLIWVKWLDHRSAHFRSWGLNLFCEELSSIETVPKFQEVAAPRVSDINSFLILPPQELRERFIGVMNRRNLAGVAQFARDQLRILSWQPSFYCLRRDILHSIEKVANSVDRYVLQAKNQGISSIGVERILGLFIFGQLMGLEHAHQLDLLAAPLQKEGYPILCQELPVDPQ